MTDQFKPGDRLRLDYLGPGTLVMQGGQTRFWPLGSLPPDLEAVVWSAGTVAVYVHARDGTLTRYTPINR